jgi:predicted transcriptional regulator
VRPFRFSWRPRTPGALGSVFGELELRAMEALWRLPEATVAEVHAAFSGSLAYTTVMTTLDRLYKKGALERRKRGRAYVYRARRSREEMQQGVIRRVVGSLLGPAPAEPVLSSLVDAVSEQDRGLLDDLERLVRERRRRLERGGR